jgi:hypothetical protein
VGELLGSLVFFPDVIAVIAACMAWISTLFRKGSMALLRVSNGSVSSSRDDPALLERAFRKALASGGTRFRGGSRHVVRIDLRPEVFRFCQGAVSSERFAVNLILSRTQIDEPRTPSKPPRNLPGRDLHPPCSRW